MFEYIDYSLTFIDDIRSLAAPYLLGDFNSCEVTEIFGFIKNSRSPVNIYTLIAFEKSDDPQCKSKQLADEPIHIKGLKNWSFGIQRTGIAPDVLYAALSGLFKDKKWSVTGKPLDVGVLTALPRKFVPSEAESIPVNSLLKNNFWNGSYIFELFSQEKHQIYPFLETPSLLQELSKKIERYCPINLAVNSDRLGSIIMQLPVRCVYWNITPSVIEVTREHISPSPLQSSF